MNLFSIITVSIIAFTNGVLSQNCANPVRRPEIRELTPTQLTAFINAVRALRNRNGVDVFLQSASTHYNNVGAAHGVPAFFPWHREYLKRYELALQAVDPSVVLPYWDWSRDAQAPERSPIFTNSYFGGNGQSPSYCLLSGPFSGYRTTVGGSHCLRRNFNGGSTISAFYSGEALEAIINRSTTFDSLRQSIEGGPHGVVHTGIGGNNGDMSFMYSPNDPIFYMHHAFVDMLWAEWQARKPTLANTYNGRAGSTNVNTNNNLSPFNIPVSSTLNTRSARYCYYYNRYSANAGAVTAASNNVASPLRRRQLLNVDINTSLNNVRDSVNDIINLKPFTQFNRNQGDNSLLNPGNLVKVNVSPYDRSVRNKLRTPEPLSNSYIAMNNLDVNSVRQTESFVAELFAKLNTMPGFTPYSNLNLNLNLNIL